MEEFDYKELIENLSKEKDIKNLDKIKIAVLSTYTSNNILYPLRYHLMKQGFDAEIKFGGYNQFIQELMDPTSWVYSFMPDVILIGLSSRTYLKDIEYELLHQEDQKFFDKLIEEKFSVIKSAISTYNLPSKIILTSLDYPTYSPYDLIDIVTGGGIHSIIDSFNKELILLQKENPNVVLLDFEKLCAYHGKKNMFEEKLFYLGKILLTSKGAENLSFEILKIINAAYGKTKKCLVADLDNTLWGGIVGEDGVNGIKIGEDTNIGSIYSEIQKILLNYKRMGILLCIASKNNPEDVEQAFKENKGMILKESDIILKKINWGSKSKNIEEIAKELNISLDSIVFLDDNPAERLEIKSLLPMVEVIDFPEDISLLPRILKSIPFFSTIAITEEDKKRHEMYQQDKKRGEFSKALSLEEYLKKLEIKISVKKNNISSLDRITQIINKTNQFNLRTQRYTKEKIKEMMESHDHIVASLNVKDKFGDLGLTGVIIIKKDNAYFIDTFLMSCRILSRNIEQQFFIEACRFLEDKQAEIIAEYIPTQKNKQVESLYESFGLNLLENSGIKKYKKVLGEINLKDVANIEVEKN